jgi:hypothetical protein
LCCAGVINSIRKDQTMRSFALLIAALVGLTAMPASARDYKAGTLTIKQAARQARHHLAP